MRNEIPVRILVLVFLVLSALDFGCGGGAAVNSTPVEPPSTAVSAGDRMQAPMLGFVYTASANVARAINGIPGAAILGSPLTVPEGIASLSFAPGQMYALAEQAEGAPLGLVAFSGAGPGALLQIAGAIPKPDVISFSPHGAAAALYSASEGLVQVLTGLPGNPRLARQITSGELPNAVRLLAIADDGVTLLAGTANNSVYLLSSDGAQLIDSVSDLGGMVFTPKSNDLVIFDRGAGTLSLVQGLNGAQSKRVLAQGLTGLGGNIFLETDGQLAVVTASSASRLWEIDLESQAVQEVQLPTTAAMLEPLRLQGQYLLAWQPGEPAWILNTNQAKGTVYFVPAALEAAQAARSGGL